MFMQIILRMKVDDVHLTFYPSPLLLSLPLKLGKPNSVIMSNKQQTNKRNHLHFLNTNQNLFKGSKNTKNQFRYTPKARFHHLDLFQVKQHYQLSWNIYLET